MEPSEIQAAAAKYATVSDHVRFWWWFFLWHSATVLSAIPSPFRKHFALTALANCTKCYVSRVNTDTP